MHEKGKNKLGALGFQKLGNLEFHPVKRIIKRSGTKIGLLR